MPTPDDTARCSPPVVELGPEDLELVPDTLPTGQRPPPVAPWNDDSDRDVREFAAGLERAAVLP